MSIISLEVEIDLYPDQVLDQIDDKHLIEELESRNYYVSKDEIADLKLTDEELDYIADDFYGGKPGSLQHSIYEKVRKK